MATPIAAKDPQPKTGKPPAPHKAFARLGRFSPITLADAEKKYGVTGVSEDWSLSDIFGSDPAFVFVLKGPIVLEGDLAIDLRGDNAGLYVVDGNLVVHGALTLSQSESGSVLFVTHDLEAKHLSIGWDAHLWVGGNVDIAGTLHDGLSDGGELCIRGGLSAKSIVRSGRSPSPFARTAPRATETFEELLEGLKAKAPSRPRAPRKRK